VADLILKHHEKWDGSGYPFRLVGEEIPVECRILAVVDAYDAMTNDRPYSTAISRDEALEEIKRCKGSQFDPQFAELFVSLF
jgi:HD-GYP domain-containing protein (c-di-GMP phosphodiesterase class II)